MTQESFLNTSSQQESNVGASEPAIQEKMIPQSEVNRIVQSATERVRDKTRRELQQIAPAQADNYLAQQPAQNATVPVFDETKMRQIAAEEAQKRQDEKDQYYHKQLQLQQGQKMANDYIARTESNKHKYPDYDKVVGEFIEKLPGGYADIADIVGMSSGFEDPAGITYELAKNPVKIGLIRQAYQVSPNIGLAEMQRLSESIRINNDAQRVKLPNDPLGHIKPSPVNTDSGKMTVSAFRKAFSKR
jgi:hypothetical protein